MNRILIVDDEQEVINMLQRNLEVDGFEVDGATGKEEALEKFRDKLHPLVLLDIKIPGTSGPELLREFNDINPLVNVVMITGYSSMENVVECLGNGAVDYFTKPVNMDQMVETCKQLDQKIDRWRDSIGMG